MPTSVRYDRTGNKRTSELMNKCSIYFVTDLFQYLEQFLNLPLSPSISEKTFVKKTFCHCDIGYGASTARGGGEGLMLRREGLIYGKGRHNHANYSNHKINHKTHHFLSSGIFKLSFLCHRP